MKKVEKLTPLAVNRQTKAGYYGDGNNLWLQVSKTGSKSWVFRFTRAGRQREMGLGPVHTVPLSAAREQAKHCRLMLLQGKDPLEVRTSERKAAALTEAMAAAKLMTFDACAAAYIETKRHEWKNAKHVAQWSSTLATYASPVIGSLPVGQVDLALVQKILAPIWKTKNETASRLRGRIESVLDWATVCGYREGPNPAEWAGNLKTVMAAPGKVKRVDHHAALPWQEVGEFMLALRKQQGMGAKALELAILTACRSGEVRLACWAEFDLDQATWTIPAGRMKAGKEHRIPLSAPAMTLLKTLPRSGELVFPGARAGSPLSDMSLTAVLRRMGRDDITVHGFRSSFRDWAAEATHFPREVAEHALAHSLPDKVEAAYRRGDLLTKRIELMKAWANFCGAISTPATVTPIRGAAAA